MKRIDYVYQDHYATAKKRAPWATRFLRVPGAFLAFESVDDYYAYKARTGR